MWQKISCPYKNTYYSKLRRQQKEVKMDEQSKVQIEISAQETNLRLCDVSTWLKVSASRMGKPEAVSVKRNTAFIYLEVAYTGFSIHLSL